MTIRDIIIKYSQELEKISDTPRLDVELFLQKALGDVDRIYIHLNLNKELTKEQYDEFLGYIKDRINGRPVAYIVGNREFMGLDFFVKEGVLIPRPDTETLVEEIIELCKNKNEEINIVDIGTGSGILAICAKKFGASTAYGCDNDETVIDVCIENAGVNNIDDIVFELNTADKLTKKYDFVCANILHNVLAEIMGDLKNIMKPKAKMVLSGILDEKKPVVLDAIQKHGLKIIETIYQDQWVAFVVEN